MIYQDGGIGPARLEIDESSQAREAHGDRVVALALALLASNNAPRQGRPEEEGLPDWSVGTLIGIPDELR